MPPTDRLRAALSDRYTLERELGAGGMATVYLARDVKYDRHVAVKVLHPDLAAALGGERFLREIRTTAKLQHPHILPLLDSGDADGTLYYVMPAVAGETLRARLERERQLPIPDAVRIAREVASALDYAHRHGVIHRDVKPENILLHDDQALVADFGIALAVESAGGARMTQTGLSLGTPQYMAPEQAMGERAIDARADVYALGAVTYEMLTGEPPFTGATVQAIVAKVIAERPVSIVTIRDTVPHHIEQAVLTALAKLPADRFAAAADFAAALDSATVSAGHVLNASAVAPSTRRISMLGVVAAVMTGVVGVAIGSMRTSMRESDASHSVTRLVTRVPAGTFLPDVPGTQFALSPDGAAMAYVGQGPQGTQLFVKRMSELSASVVPGTAGATSPFYSADGRWLAFFSDGTLKRAPVGGGPVETIVKAAADEGTWGADGTIVYRGAKGLELIPANGGPSRQITSALGDSIEHSWPFVVASGDAVLFTIHNWNQGLEHADVAAVSLKTGAVKTLVRGAFNARVLSTGHLLFARASGTLEAARFDSRRLELLGKPVAVLDSVRVEPAGELDIAVSDNGTLVYLPASSLNRRVMRVDRSGHAVALIDRVAFFEFPTFSPNGRQLAARVFEPSGLDLWVYDIARGTGARIGPGGATAEPAWSPDGREVAFTVGGALQAFAVDGSGAARTFLPSQTAPVGSWTRDGKQLLVSDQRGIVLVTPGASSSTRIVVPGLAGQPALSRDGRWLAYVSSDGGRSEVNVRRFPDGARAWRVSTDGGSEPRWRADGQELFYRRGRHVVGVPIHETGGDLAIGKPVTLFEAPFVTMTGSRMWDVSPTGDGFVMVEGHEFHDEFITVLNWLSDVSKRVGR